MPFTLSSAKIEELNLWIAPAHAPRESRNLVETLQKPWPKNRPLVSVIVPCFNYGKYINLAIDSILSQSWQDFEVIVVEGGSTDGVTPEIVKKIKHPKIKVFIRKGRRLVGDNRNFGINKARGKYVCCLDADDTLSATFLEKGLFLLECGGYDMVSTNYRFFGDRESEVVLPAQPSFAQMIGGAALANIAIFTKKLWAKTGGYRDTGTGREHIPEDWDFYVKAAGRGARIYNVQETLLNVRRHDDSLSRNPQNPKYSTLLQIIRKRHSKILRFKNFENFVRRNESICRVSSGTLNLLNRQPINTKFGTLIIPPTVLNEDEIIRHSEQLKRIDKIAANGAVVIICRGSIRDLPKAIYDEYYALSTGALTNIFSLNDVASDQEMKMTLLDYLIQSRRINKFIVGSKVFDAKNQAHLFELYDRL